MIQFDADAHIYTNDEGVRIPSVTQILKWYFPEKYEGVPKETLEVAAEYGNRIHAWIEAYAQTGKKKRQTPIMRVTTNQVIRIIAEEQMEITCCEEIVEGVGYAGMFDMYGTVHGRPALIDIKATAMYDKAWLEWQLGMYKKALEEARVVVQDCYCLWVPKGQVAKLIAVEPVTAESIDWMVWRYEQEHSAG